MVAKTGVSVIFFCIFVVASSRKHSLKIAASDERHTLVFASFEVFIFVVLIFFLSKMKHDTKTMQKTKELFFQLPNQSKIGKLPKMSVAHIFLSIVFLKVPSGTPLGLIIVT